MEGNITLGFAFLAGLASFLSPCVFSLVPAYIGYLGGRSAATADTQQTGRWQTFSHGLAFVLGFSVVFILLGITTSVIGGLLYTARPWLTRIGGIAVIIFGLHMTGILRIPFLEYDLRPQSIPDRNRGYLASALMGVFFSAGWSPCVGPILGSILVIPLAGGPVMQGAVLLAAYSAGLGLPFLFASTQIGLVTTVIRRYGKVMHYVEVVMGVVLIIVGALLFMNRFAQLSTLAFFFTNIDEVSVGRLLLAGLLILAVLALIPAALAARKGKDFINWWLFGLGLFPVALVAAFLIRDEKPVEANEKSVEGGVEALSK
jgi:cytochrome c-type biogenesis protein